MTPDPAPRGKPCTSWLLWQRQRNPWLPSASAHRTHCCNWSRWTSGRAEGALLSSLLIVGSSPPDPFWLLASCVWHHCLVNRDIDEQWGDIEADESLLLLHMFVLHRTCKVLRHRNWSFWPGGNNGCNVLWELVWRGTYYGPKWDLWLLYLGNL